MPLRHRSDFKQALSTLQRLQQAGEEPHVLAYSYKHQQWEERSSSSTWWNWQGSWWSSYNSESQEGGEPSLEWTGRPVAWSIGKDSSAKDFHEFNLFCHRLFVYSWRRSTVTDGGVKTTPQMTRFRGSKVCSKWLQGRIDDHNIQSDYKCTIKLKVQTWEFNIGMLCLCGDVARLHDRHQWRHDKHDCLPHRAHQHEHLSVPSLVHLVSAYRHIAHCTPWLKSELCPSFQSHPLALMMCAVLPRHWSLHSLHPLPLAPPVALLPLPHVEARRVPVHSAQKWYGLHWRDPLPHKNDGGNIEI